MKEDKLRDLAVVFVGKGSPKKCNGYSLLEVVGIFVEDGNQESDGREPSERARCIDLTHTNHTLL